MNKILSLGLVLSLGACSLFQHKPDEGSSAPAPRVREDFKPCPDSEECGGHYQGGGICVPSMEHHSDQGKCPFKK